MKKGYKTNCSGEVQNFKYASCCIAVHDRLMKESIDPMRLRLILLALTCFVCMVTHITRARINRVRLSVLLLVVS